MIKKTRSKIDSSKIYLIDGSSFLYRAFYAMRPLHTSTGVQVHAVYGFCRMLKKIIKSFKPQYMALVWDSKGKTERHEIFSDYKATRDAAPSELFHQKDKIVVFADLIGLKQVAVSGIEADDLITYGLIPEFVGRLPVVATLEELDESVIQQLVELTTIIAGQVIRRELRADPGQVIGVDMTPEMVDRARSSAERGGYTNVEFKLGVIEGLPVADNSIDAVISNCVINLSPDKKKVFQEVFRVLKPGGRMMISDIVLTRELPRSLKESVEGYHACVSGAMVFEEYLGCIETAGFQGIKVIDQTPFPFDLLTNDPTATAIIEEAKIAPTEAKEIAETIVSLKVQAYKTN